ncbi:MAG: hypothetical protein LKI39_00950 [Bacteroides sp.]|jgi:hypothetical protein|nr:hypothetical protein [Bacteroides sp.]
MFLNERVKTLIEDLRNPEEFYTDTIKSAICDAMSVIVQMYQFDASTEEGKEALIKALNVLSDYDNLITELAKEK